MAETILSLEGVHTHIGRHHILQGVSFDVNPGKATVLLGRNGAGKSTTLRTIMGLSPASSGSIRFQGQAVEALKPYEIARRGVGFVAEDQAVFYTLSVEENFRLAMMEEKDKYTDQLDTIFELFPDLRKFWHSRAGILSGGQKQMLAIALAIINDHSLLLIDEPSKGLAPIIVEHLGESLVKISDRTTVILVEQNFYLASRVATDYFILDDGRVVHQGIMEDLKADQELKQKYLGIS